MFNGGLIGVSSCCLSRRDPLRLSISLPCVTLSFESLKLLRIYLLLLIIGSGLIYWHDAHIYLFITFMRIVRGLFRSRTFFWWGTWWDKNYYGNWSWGFFFFRWIEAFFKTMVSPVRITAVSEAHGIFFWWADYWHTIDRRAVTCCRRPWQWVDLTSCCPFSRVWWRIYFTSFVFGCKMDVSCWETLS